jgi:hypothetical protein
MLLFLRTCLMASWLAQTFAVALLKSGFRCGAIDEKHRYPRQLFTVTLRKMLSAGER